MQETQRLAKQLEMQIPFLRQKLSGLDSESQHFKKISLLIQLITNPSIRYSTLIKVEKVIDILRNKEKRGKICISSPPRQERLKTAAPAVDLRNNSFDAIPTIDEKIASVRSHFEDVLGPKNIIQSPDDNSIQSPDDIGGSDVSDRYENDILSIYSVVADTIKPPQSPVLNFVPPPSERSPALNFIPPPPLVPVVPTVDTSKPPISAEDLEELLLQVRTLPCVEKSEEVKKEDAVVTDADAMLSGCGGHKSKVSLVPAPFHVRKDKTEKKECEAEKIDKNSTGKCDRKVAEKSGSKDKVRVCNDKERDKSRYSEKVRKTGKSDTKESNDTIINKDSKEIKSSKATKTSDIHKDTKNLKDSKDNKDSKVSEGSKDTKNKTTKSKTKSSDKKDKSRPVEKIVESESIFGSLFSTLDAKLISDQTRRDSKDGDQRCDSKSSSSSASTNLSKDKHIGSSRKSELTRLANKIKTTEKDMEAALNKAMTEADIEEVRKKYTDKIKRYKKDIERQGRMSCDEKREDKVRDSAKGKGKEKNKDKGREEKKKSRTKDSGGMGKSKDGCKLSRKSESKKDEPALEKSAINGDQPLIADETEGKVDQPSTEDLDSKWDQPSAEQSRKQEHSLPIDKPVSQKDQLLAEKSSGNVDALLAEKGIGESETKTTTTEKVPVLDTTPKGDLKTDIKSFAEKYPSSIKVVKKPKSVQLSPICADLPLPLKKADDVVPPAIINTSSVQPLLPPPLPLGFQDFNPFANETAELNRLQRKREEKLRSPLHEVGNDHIQHGLMNNIQSMPRDWNMKDPRVWSRANNAHMHQTQQPQCQLILPNWIPPTLTTRDPRSTTRDLPRQSRWEPPPAVRGEGHQKQDYMGMWFIPPPPQPPTHLPGFHPFEPIGNEYDLSKMPPTDFYHPTSPLSDVPKNYREWKQLKKMEERQALRFKEVEEVELARSAKIKQANEALAKEVEEVKNQVEEKVQNDINKVKTENVEVDNEETLEDKNSDVLKSEFVSDQQQKEEETNSQLQVTVKEEDNQKETEKTSEEIVQTPEKASPTKPTGRVLRPRRKSLRLNHIDDEESDIFLNDTISLSPPVKNVEPLLKTPTKSPKQKELASPSTPQSQKKVTESPRRKSRRLNPIQPEDEQIEETYTQKDQGNTSKDDSSLQSEPILHLEEPSKEAKVEEPSQLLASSEESNEGGGRECEPKTVIDEPSSSLAEVVEPAHEENFESLLQQMNETEVNRDSLLKILGQTKNKVSPTRILEMLEYYLQNQDSSSKKPSSDAVEAQPEKEGQKGLEQKKETEGEDSGNKEVTTTEDVIDDKAILIPQNTEIRCSRRLRRRTTINYTEFRISDSDESPKRKKKLVESSVSLLPEEPEVKTELEVDIERIDDRNEVLATRLEENPSDETHIEEFKIEKNQTQVGELIEEPNIVKIIDAVAGGLGSLEEKRQQIIQKQGEAELSSLLNIIKGVNGEEMSAFLAEISGASFQSDSGLQPTPSPILNLIDASSLLDDDKEKRVPPKARRSELDILHMDIKACLGEGIMTSRRSTASVSSRASSPGSVKSYASSKDFNLISNRELAEMKDVKLPPAVDELFKSRKTLKVVLQKLPDSREIRGGSPVTAQSNKGNKTLDNTKRDRSIESPMPIEKHLQLTIDAESEQITKKLKLGKGHHDKNYYLRAEKNDDNECHVCGFVGPLIITHYIMEHPESEVLISRLSPNSTQEAFQESVINDYNALDVNTIGGKKTAKFDFRCRFCSHDLQKEPTSAFYDHVSTHTGEARFRCPECPFKHHVKVTVKKHITFAHGQILEPLMDEPPKNYEKLFGYICSECNYLQLRKEAVNAHIEKFHSAEPVYTYTINMSLPILKRTMKMQKDECVDHLESPLIHPARKLRSSQRSKKPEVPTAEERDGESSKKREVSKKLGASKLRLPTEPDPSNKKDNLTNDIATFELPEDLQSSIPDYKEFKEPTETPSAPSTAFVCDNWDELLNKPEESAPITDIKLTSTKRNSSFLDALKKRLEEQYLLPPADTDIDRLRSTTPTDQQIKVKMEVISPGKISANNEGPSSSKYSVGFVEANIDSNIKMEQNPEDIQIIEPEVPIYDVDLDFDDDDIVDQQDLDKIIPSQNTPPKMTLVISKVESLAVQQPPSCLTSPIFSEADVNTSTPKENNRSKTGLMVYLKSPAIIAEWLQTSPEVLLKCPEYNCDFSTLYESVFDNHLEKHEFEGGMINCLYCPTSLRKNDYKSHVINLHISSMFGCGHCLYRAVLDEYVEEHHQMAHPDKSLTILHFSNVCAKYMPPSRLDVPAVRSVVKPYVCGCRKEYYVIQNYRHHRSVCQSLAGADQVKDLSLFNCRYCMRGGSTPRDIMRHQAIMHPHQLLHIVTRKTKSKTPIDDEPPNITYQLLIMNLSMYKRFQNSQEKKHLSSSQVVVAPPPPTLAPVVTITVGNNLPRFVLGHPVVLGTNTKSAVLVVPTASLTTSASTMTAPATSSAPTTPSEPNIATTSSMQPATVNAPITPAAPSSPSKIAKMPPTLSPSSSKQIEDLFRCSGCRLVCMSSQELLEHVYKCQPDRHFACYHCKKVYRQAPVLIQHIKTHGNKNLICGLCGHKEATLSILKKHIRDEHKMNNIALQPLVPEKSNIDFDFFIGKPTMIKSIVSSDKSAKPKGKDIETAENLTAFGPGDIKLLPKRPIFNFMASCKICKFETKVRSNFLRHLILHSSGQFDFKLHFGQAVNPVPCLEKNELMFDKMTNLAASSFEGRMSLKMNRASTATTATELTTPIDTPAGQVAEKVSNVPMYIPEDRRYICGATGCNYLSLEEPHLRHHLQALHDNEQYFKCIHCKIEVTTSKEGKEGKSAFIDIDHIMNHFRLHEMELFQCPYCDYLNPKPSNVEKHCMEKHPDKQPNFIMLRGESKDKQSSSVENVKPVRKRPWKCAVCLCRKSTEEDIKAHAKEKHRLQGQFKCTYCHFTGDNKPVMEKHSEGDHPNLSPDVIVAYLRDDKEELNESVENSFDTTPLWLKNRASVKHIRGILLDLEAVGSKKASKITPAKASPVKAVGKGRRPSMKIVDGIPNKKQKLLPTDEEEIVFVVEEEPPTNATTSTAESPQSKPLTPINKPKFKVYSKTPPVLPKKSKTSDVIEIPDDSENAVNFTEDSTDPSLSTLEKMPLQKLLKSDFVSTYGPLGRPAGINFICPLCNLMNIPDEVSFREHIFEEMQYNQYKCTLCGHQVITSAKMILHFGEKHQKQHDDEDVKQLPSNESIEMWFAKVLAVQKRIISFNRAKHKRVFYKCGHCKYKTKQYMIMMAHVGAAHPELPVKVTELTLFKTTKPTGVPQTPPKIV